MEQYKDKYPDWFDEDGNYIPGSKENRIERIKDKLRDANNKQVYGQGDDTDISALQTELAELSGTQIDTITATESKVREMFFASAIPSVINGFGLTNKEALAVKDYYPEWTEKAGEIKEKDKYKCDGNLWECIKGHTAQANWKPGLQTASIWKIVEEEHKGTEDDPIPYTPPMDLYKGKYYTQNGQKYKCTRDSGIPLSHNLSDLVGIYVELIMQK